MVDQLKVLFVGLAGAAAAIPGMAALSKFEAPTGTSVLFEFVLAAFSAAAVLTVYILRERFRSLSSRQVLVATGGGMLLVLLLLFSHVWILNKVFVLHQYRGEPERQFMTLTLPAKIDSLIQVEGSRSQFINKYGVDALHDYTSEVDVALTVVTMLTVYTLLVASLATVFTVLGVRALAAGHDPGSGADGGL